MSLLHAFTTNLQKYSCQSWSFSFGHNVLVSLGLNLLIVLTTEIKPQNIFPGFIYSLKQRARNFKFYFYKNVYEGKDTEHMHYKRLSP